MIPAVIGLGKTLITWAGASFIASEVSDTIGGGENDGMTDGTITTPVIGDGSRFSWLKIGVIAGLIYFIYKKLFKGK